MQQEANNLSVAQTYLYQVPSLFVIVVAGAWADVYGGDSQMDTFVPKSTVQIGASHPGRKLMLLLAIVGTLYGNAVYLVNVVFFEQLSADYLVLTGLVNQKALNRPCTGP